MDSLFPQTSSLTNTDSFYNNTSTYCLIQLIFLCTIQVVYTPYKQPLWQQLLLMSIKFDSSNGISCWCSADVVHPTFPIQIQVSVLIEAFWRVFDNDDNVNTIVELHPYQDDWDQNLSSFSPFVWRKNTPFVYSQSSVTLDCHTIHMVWTYDRIICHTLDLEY